MASQEQLSFDKASAWPSGLSMWTVFLCTCLLAAGAFLVVRYVHAPKIEHAVPYSVEVPPQLAGDYQWDVKGKRPKADSPEVSGHTTAVILELEH